MNEAKVPFKIRIRAVVSGIISLTIRKVGNLTLDY